MSEPTNFYDVIEELDFITHVPTRLILAHLVFFYKVDADVAYLLWMHYRHCNTESIEIIDKWMNKEELSEEEAI